MTDLNDDAPSPDSPPLNGSGFGRPAQRRGAARGDAVPMLETVRVTEPDLRRRAAMEKTRGRLVVAAFGFMVLFLAVVGRLADATILRPLAPHRPERSLEALVTPARPAETGLIGERAMIMDRNGQTLAVSMPTVSLFADPRQIIDPADAAHKLKQVLPRMDEARAAQRLGESGKYFVYLERQITPREELAINNLGIPGIDFRPTEQRRYPMGRTAAHVLGGVDVDENGVAGVEKYFDKRLREDQTPLRLSLDVRVEAVVREELLSAMQTFDAIGAAGIVMDVNTGELLAVVSLPDYDANDFRSASEDDKRNRAIKERYEPGSTFKLQTASMALDSGLVHIWDEFDASHPISIGRFTITDFEGKHRWLYLPEVLAYSSNLGAAHIAQFMGSDRQQAWLKSMGMFGKTGVELPEAGLPIIQAPSAWKEIVTMTVGFGHGISVTPLHVVRGTAAVANGGVLLRPTILALPPGDHPEGVRVMQQSTSDTMRKLMRLVVTDGFGKSAEVAGYYPGGKTGTAEKASIHGYRKHANVAAFMSVFPMNAPRYAVYMMLDEPHGNKSTYGYSTAGWVAAPAAGRVIARIGPMLGLMPDTQDAPTINASLAIPLEPGRPPGAPARGPMTAVESVRPAGPRPVLTVPATVLPPATPRPRETRRETSIAPATPVVATASVASVAAR
ncbi:MAG: penicillin-binding transpeptidase domain-containing protein [Acetobacteraceae bacterium]|nr:penicillin-binding transpeptidase domain-containing protein [Acetobacteraceae bacterium]